jgi:hypothetical protein
MEADFVSREHTTGPILIASDVGGSMTAWMSAGFRGLPCYVLVRCRVDTGA